MAASESRIWRDGLRLQRRRFTESSDVRRFPHGRVEVVELDDHVLGLMVYEPGWRWSTDVKPIAATDTCQYHHMSTAAPGEILVSSTVMDLVDGSDLAFEDAGLHELKGFAGKRQLFRLVS